MKSNATPQTTPPTRPAARRRAVATLAVVLIVAGASTAYWWHTTRLPKRFAAVAPGRLYRSGEVSPAQLERLQHDYGIGRVICLLNENAPVTVAERDAAQRLGLRWENVSLTGDGASTPEDRARILSLLTEPNAPPTLVHCAAGVNRTGLAVGLYRRHVEGWSYDQVLEELLEFDFENLPKHESLRQALASPAPTTQPAAPE
jgi:protein tyrosine/serine phosphatase